MCAASHTTSISSSSVLLIALYKCQVLLLVLKKGVQQNGVQHSAFNRVSCLQALSFIGRCLEELDHHTILVSQHQQILLLPCSEGSAKGAVSKKGSKAKPKDVQAERVQQRKSRKREKASLL